MPTPDAPTGFPEGSEVFRSKVDALFGMTASATLTPQGEARGLFEGLSRL
jgi:hypothetical protein